MSIVCVSFNKLIYLQLVAKNKCVIGQLYRASYDALQKAVFFFWASV